MGSKAELEDVPSILEEPLVFTGSFFSFLLLGTLILKPGLAFPSTGKKYFQDFVKLS